VYKSEVPNHWWDTLNGIVEKNMLHHFVRSDGTLRFHPKRDLTKSGENMGDPRATQRSEAFFNKPPRTDIPEFDFLETELGYDKNQRQVLPFMFSFMYDAYTFMNDLRTGKLIWRKLEVRHFHSLVHSFIHPLTHSLTFREVQRFERQMALLV